MTSSHRLVTLATGSNIMQRRALRIAVMASAVALFTLALPGGIGGGTGWSTATASAASMAPSGGKSISDRDGKASRGKAEGSARGERNGRAEHGGRGGRHDRDGRDRDHGRHHDGEGSRDGHDRRGGHDGRGDRHGHGGWGRGGVDEAPSVATTTRTTTAPVTDGMRNNPDLLLPAAPR